MTGYSTCLMRWLGYGLSSWALGLSLAGSLPAEMGLHRGSDGIDGTLTVLSDGTTLYADPHGTFGPALQVPQPIHGGSITLPHGQTAPGLTVPFGVPAPPSHLTPAPVLPFHPQGSLVPQPPIPPPSRYLPGQGQGAIRHGSQHR